MRALAPVSSSHRAVPFHQAAGPPPCAARPHGVQLRTKPFSLSSSLASPCKLRGAEHNRLGLAGQCRLVASASKGTAEPAYEPTSAKDAIETGLKLFNERKAYVEAARLFNLSLEMKPSEDEAMAALYNLGCAYTKLKQWKPAADAIVRAINDHKLKLSVALKDDDLRELRDRREWIDALTEVKGGLSREMKLEMRSEARAPFRLPRVFLFGSLAVGAGIGLLIITTRLIASLKGGEGAPDLTESITNFAINSVALVGLSYLVYRDVKAKESSIKVTDREELLSRLQLDLGKGRVLPLIKFRGSVRPVIIAGTKSYVDKCIKDAEPYYAALRERGVSVIPLFFKDQVGELDPDAKIRALKREFQRKDTSKGFGGAKEEKPAEVEDTPGSEAILITDEDKKWKLAAYEVDEWQEWVEKQKEFAGLKNAERKNCYMQIQLDGTVRLSSLGTPNWAKMVDDLPELTSVRTSFTDGIGPSI